MYIKQLLSKKAFQNQFLNVARKLWKIQFKSYASSTIFSLSSGAGKCGVAVIRVSGPKTKESLTKICGSITKPRVASLHRLLDPNSQEVLDKAIVLWFPGPHSFTGEDCAEFHVHGGPAVISSVLSALNVIDGFRPAQPGEFSRQAFLNGKLDLTEVEGLGDLIHAETEAQRKQALRQMEGDLGRIYTQWRTRLVKCLANAEAFIDFHEDENIEGDILESVTTEVTKIQQEISDHLKDSRCGERLRDGLRVVILGEPNVGKSSLLNAISQRPAAIVSPIAGTTRDIIETALNIAGYPVLLSDTAGLRETSDVVEKEGVSRALERANSADLKILMLDSSSGITQLKSIQTLTDFFYLYMQKLGLLETKIANECEDNENEVKAQQVQSNIFSKKESIRFTNLSSGSRKRVVVDNSYENMETIPQAAEIRSRNTVDFSNWLVVINKCDLATDGNPGHEFISGDNVCRISCKTGEGLATFMELFVGKIKTLCGDPNLGSPSLTQTRHRHHLNKCQGYLNEYRQYIHHDVVLAAERLRLAARELGQVTGAVSIEDVLDVIFRDFCIGK